MDRSGCPAGYATDGLFLYDDETKPNPCEANFVFFVAIFTLLSVWRSGVALIQLKAWRMREREVAKQLGKNRHRWPVFPIASALQAAALIMFTILASLNIANASNGITALLLGVFYTPMLFAGQLMVMRLVRLGKKLIPLSKRSTFDSNDNVSVEAALNKVNKSDAFLKITYAVGFLVAVIHPTALVIAGPIRPIFLTFQIGILCLAVDDITLVAGVTYQYHRLITAIESNQYPKDRPLDVRSSKIREVVRKMRAQQLIWAFGGCSACAMWVLNASKAVPPTYWYSIFYFLVEILFTTASTLSLASKVLGLSGSSAPASTTDGARPPIVVRYDNAETAYLQEEQNALVASGDMEQATDVSSSAKKY